MTTRVDVAVIGAGTAGINAISEVRKVTDRFVLINHGALGTTCARVGCMPSKLMIQVADDYHRRRSLAEEGIAGADGLSIDVDRAMTHVRAMRDDFVGGIVADVIEPLGDRFVEGRARFLEPTLLEVGRSRIRARSVVIATGSRPVIPSPWKHLGEHAWTTDTVFEQARIPRRIAVVGLGVIGLELGQALTRMGLDVVAFEQGERIGGLQDPDVNRSAVEIFEGELTMYCGTEARIEKTDGGLRVSADDRDILVDKVLLSVGRTPNIDDLGIEALGVELDDEGIPVFDRHTMQVGDLPVFIAGDVSNDRPVLHEVAHEGTVAGYNAVRSPVRRFERKAPLLVCFSDPNICTAGASWSEVADRHPAVGTASFDGGRERIMLQPRGRVSLYADRRSGVLLGAEMVAPEGEHLAHLLAWGIQQKLTVFDLLAMPFYHPTVEETLRGALMDLAEDIEAEPHPLPGFASMD